MHCADCALAQYGAYYMQLTKLKRVEHIENDDENFCTKNASSNALMIFNDIVDSLICELQKCYRSVNIRHLPAPSS